MKLTRKIVGIVVCFTLLFTTLMANAASASTGSVTQSFDLGNGVVGSVKIEENDETRTVEYFENDIKMQIAVLDKKTEDIYYYDLQEVASANNLESANVHFSSNENQLLTYTAKYNVDDFRVVNEYPSKNLEQSDGITLYASTLVKSLFFNEYGDQYSRYLYGEQLEKQYERTSWHFEAGIGLSIILAAVGIVFSGITAAVIIAAVGVSGGVILSLLTVTEWVKDFYWKYNFLQTSPVYMAFDIHQDFVYKRQNRVELNGDTGYWETFYEQSSSDIDYVRTDILNWPGKYM